MRYLAVYRSPETGKPPTEQSEVRLIHGMA